MRCQSRYIQLFFQVDTELAPPKLCQPLYLPPTIPSLPPSLIQLQRRWPSLLFLNCAKPSPWNTPTLDLHASFLLFFRSLPNVMSSEK